MPFLFGIGYAGQRIATAVARACGGGIQAQCEARKLVARLTVPIDPLGTLLGFAHEMAKVAADEGSDLGRNIDSTLNIAATVDRAADLMLPSGGKHRTG